MDTTDNPIFHDQYTFVHFMDGLFFYLLITHFFNLGFVKGFILWFILHLIYELKDLYFSYIKPVPPNEIILYGLISNNSWQNTALAMPGTELLRTSHPSFAVRGLTAP